MRSPCSVPDVFSCAPDARRPYLDVAAALSREVFQGGDVSAVFDSSTGKEIGRVGPR